MSLIITSHILYTHLFQFLRSLYEFHSHSSLYEFELPPLSDISRQEEIRLEIK